MSAKATRIYANPLENDPHIISGESGSVPLGLAYTALHDEDAKDLKEALTSSIMCKTCAGPTKVKNSFKGKFIFPFMLCSPFLLISRSCYSKF